MSFTVYTFGGGEYLWAVFNAVAAIAGSNGYLNIIAMTATFGLVWILLQSSFNNNFRASVSWMLSFLLFYNVMFLPKSTVVVVDPLSSNHRYEAVSNVPFALAAFASMSSTVGKNITEMMEMAFAAPDELTYHKNGMLFGSKLVAMTSQMKIQDEHFASSINSFMKQCVFYDILLHRYSINDLKSTDDIWAFLSENPSKARSFVIYSKDGTQIKTCAEGINDLKSQWNGQIDAVSSFYGKQIYGNRSNAKALFLQSLPTSYHSLIGTSKEASEIIRQNLLINSIDRAANEFSTSGSIYADVRARLQTQAAFGASKRQAEEWVPILHIVLEVLFYGMFPLVFLLFMLPIGVDVAKHYFTSFIWLQSWAPLYAILNLIMSGRASHKTLAYAPEGMTIMTQAGIAAIQADVVYIAGYLAFSIPFISIGIAKGASAITGLSASMLAVPQSAANAAAHEVSSGNISFGNTNFDNSSYGNTSANKLNTSAFFDSSRVQVLNNTGGMSTVNPDGHTVYDQSGSVSKVSNMQLSTNDTESVSLMKQASSMKNMGESYARSADQMKSNNTELLVQAMSNHSINENHGFRLTKNTSAETRESLSNLTQYIDEYAKTHSMDKASAAQAVLTATAGFGLGGGKTGPYGSLQASASLSNETKDNTSHSKAKRETDTKQFSKDVSNVVNAIKDNSLEMTDSNGNTLNETFSHNYSESNRLDMQSRLYLDTAKSFSDQAQFARSHSLSYGEEHAQDILEVARQMPDINGNPLGDRALSKLNTDPVFRQQAVDMHIQAQNMSQSQGMFNHAKNKMGVHSLESEYAHVADTKYNYENFKASGAQEVRDKFHADTQDKQIDNSHLVDAVKKDLHVNKNERMSARPHKPALRSEVNEQLEKNVMVENARDMYNKAGDMLNGKKK